MEKAARVWQRVRSGSGESLNTDSLNAMISQFLHLSTCYQALSRQVRPPQSAALKTLSDQKRNQASCLRGLHILLIGPCPSLRIAQVRAEPISTALHRCYTEETQLWTQLRILSDGTTHGAVLEALVAIQRDHCRTLAELIGQLER